MLKNYLKVAWRNLTRNKVISTINIGGLAIGIAAVLFIGLYLQTEWHYDDFHKNGKNIYRAGFKLFQKNNDLLGVTEEFVAAFAPAAKNELTGVDEFCRIGANTTAYISADNENLKLENINYVDSSFFKIFSFKLIVGNAVTALQNPFNIVLDENTALKLFGKKNAIGQSIKFNGKDNYRVTGIVQNAPANSHIQYSALVSFSTLYKDTTMNMGWNGGNQFATYFLTNNFKQIESQLPDFMWKYLNKDLSVSRGIEIESFLQPLNEIHLHYSYNSDNLKTNIQIFSLVALLILIISCVNYINLSLAQSATRFKEVGVKKVLGATKQELIKQFLGESFFVSMIALFPGVCLVYLLLPLYKKLLNTNLNVSGDVIISAFIVLLIVITIISIGAGGYIAFYLSSLKTINIFKKYTPKSGKQIFSKSLIVFQFAVASAFITCTLIVSLQINFLKNTPIGFDKEKMIVLPLVGDEAQDKAKLLKQQLAATAGVESVSAVSEMPYNGVTRNGFVPEGSKDVLMFHQLDVDENFLKTFHVDLVGGDFFLKNKQTDASGYVINEALARQLNWTNPLYKTIERDGVHKIIGVIKDFNFASLHDKIEPLVITYKPWLNRYDYIVLRYTGNEPAAILQKIKTIWTGSISSSPFDYWFFDDAFNNLYKAEQIFQQLIFYFSLLSIILSLGGIFGLVLLTLQQKTKEIGIRKVLGAGITNIIELTAKKYLYLIFIASIIVVPIAWIYMNKWLQNFAYRMQLQWWMFVVASIVTVMFALIVISIQTIKVANVNPIKNLRTE